MFQRSKFRFEIFRITSFKAPTALKIRLYLTVIVTNKSIAIMKKLCGCLGAQDADLGKLFLDFIARWYPHFYVYVEALLLVLLCPLTTLKYEELNWECCLSAWGLAHNSLHSLKRWSSKVPSSPKHTMIQWIEDVSCVVTKLRCHKFL